jgi:hypothetical protein
LFARLLGQLLRVGSLLCSNRSWVHCSSSSRLLLRDYNNNLSPLLQLAKHAWYCFSAALVSQPQAPDAAALLVQVPN